MAIEGGIWGMLELMGHRRLFGWIAEEEVAGGKMLRIDVPDEDAAKPHILTQWYGTPAIYGLTAVSEDICRKMAARSRPEPVHAYELTGPPAYARDRGDDESDDFMS